MCGKALLAVLIACPAFPQGIAGIVTGADTGAALAEAHVIAIGRGASGAPLFYEAASSADGSYTIPHVPSGSYVICAEYTPPPARRTRRTFWQAEDPVYLNPCDWGEPLRTSVGSSITEVRISLERGVKLRVEGEDPAETHIAIADASGAIRAVLQRLPGGGFTGAVPRTGRFTLRLRSVQMPFAPDGSAHRGMLLLSLPGSPR